MVTPTCTFVTLLIIVVFAVVIFKSLAPSICHICHHSDGKKTSSDVCVGTDDDDRAPQFVESCDLGSENMDQNKRTWTAWKRRKT